MNNRHTIISILGISPRSGTNFLKELICLHPNCRVSNARGEDYLLHYIDDLLAYANNVSRHWKESWNNSKANLLNSISKGVQSFLTKDLDAHFTHVVNKTPEPKNIMEFDTLFPEGKIILLIRDGRDTLDSLVHTFHHISFQKHLKSWKRNVREALITMSSEKFKQQALLVRYESLVSEPKKSMHSILNFVGLDSDQYPFGEIETLPIIGSSQIKDASGKVTWKKSAGKNMNKDTLQFVGRHTSWSWSKKCTFLFLVKKLNQALGYQ